MMIVKGQDPFVNTDKFVLDPEKGVINIGSDEENDIVIQHPSVRPFHMMLECSEKPYQIIPLDPEADISIRGTQIRSDSAIPINDLNDVRFGNFSFASTLAADGNLTADSFSIISIPDEEPSEPDIDSIETPLMFSDHDLSTPVFLSTDTTFTQADAEKEILDDVILVELLENEQSVEVDQTASYHLNIINGGPIVATFDIAVEGVPAEWVNIQPLHVNLFEGGKAGVTVTISPPRKPTSEAGLYPLRFIITSPNHAGRKTVKMANLTVGPYYDFGISDVNPLRVAIPWRKRYGEVNMEVRNRSNCPANLRLIAQDDGNECQFQFLAPNGLMQLSQVEYTIPAGETQLAPIHILPIKRSLIRLTPKQHPYRVSVTQPENETLSLFTMGTAIARPLLGILELVLTLMILAGITFFLFTPRIISFEADNSVIGLGESTTLHWETFFFTHDLSISGIDDPVNSNHGDIEIFPTETVNTYQLTATTWLWKLLNLESKQKSFTVLAVPNEPVINTFLVSDTDVLIGDYVLLRYSVSNATKVSLTINGVTEVFEDAADFNGEKNMFIDSNTLVSIEAVNALGTVVQSEYILARKPTIVIDKFEVDKTSVYKGEQVTIIWKISGEGMDDGGSVRISAFDSDLPLEGELTFFPEASMEFVLTITNREEKEVRILPVGVLDPEAEPEPPTINFFTAAPDTLTGGGEVELAWSVTGAFQSISITNGEETVASGLSAQGFRTIEVSASGTYVLTAVNQDQTAGKELTITVNPDLLTADLSITNVSRTENLSMGDTTIVSVACNSPEDDDPPPTGTVVVSDGTSSCSIALPVTSCELTFTTSGNKLITATYMGDTNYVQSKSKAWTPAIEILGNELEMVLSFKPSTGPFYFGESVDLKVYLNSSNPLVDLTGRLTLKRICDVSGEANYLEDCIADTTTYTLASTDGGVHTFKDLVVDQLGGTFEYQVTYDKDDYYDTDYETISMAVDGSILSPLSLTTTTDLTKSYSVGSHSLYVTVTDENTSGLYSTPKGTVTVTALHNDGTTRVTSSAVTLTRLDDRSSYANVSISPSKIGEWTLTAHFEPVDDIWHTSESDEIGIMSVYSDVSFHYSSTYSSNFVNLFTTTADVTLLQSDGTTPVTNGTLTCSNSTALESCSCEYDSSEFNWACAIRPKIPGTYTISYAYTPATGLHLNSGTSSRSITIVKAGTTVVISPSTLDDEYVVDDTVTLTVTAEHSLGGTYPTSVANDVTIYLMDAGYCSSTYTSSDTHKVASFDATLGIAKTITMNSSYMKGYALQFCAQYEGSSNYYASDWVASESFLVRNATTTAAITTQPAAANGTLLVGSTANITVTVTNEDSDTDPTAGDVNFQLGYGACDATNGMTTGTLGTISDVALGGDNQASTSVSLTEDYVTGNALHFCVRYEGHGNIDASSWVASNAFYVKGQPSFESVDTVEVTLSPDLDYYAYFDVVVNSAVSPDFTDVQLVDSSNNVICPNITTHYKCTNNGFDEDTGTFSYQIASDQPGTISLTPKYIADNENLAATGTAFTVDARYEVVWGGTLNISPSTFNTYSSYEQNGEDMTTDITSQFSILNYNTFDTTKFSLTPYLEEVINGSNAGAVDSSVDGCSNSTLDSFDISCTDSQINDPTVEALKMGLTPSSGTTNYYVTDSLISGYTSTTIFGNIIEDNTNTAYEPAITCDSSIDKPIINILGYTEAKEEGNKGFAGGDYWMTVLCGYNIPAGTQYRCFTFDNSTELSPTQIASTLSDCASNHTANYDASDDMNVTWGTSSPYLFTLAVSDDDFTGCPVITVDTINYSNTSTRIDFHYYTVSSEYEPFSARGTSSTSGYCH